MIEINIKTISTYVKLLGGFKEHKIKLKENSRIKELIDMLIELFGDDLKETLFDGYELRKVKRGISMFVNGRNIFALDGLDTILKSGDEILILPPIGGG